MLKRTESKLEFHTSKETKSKLEFGPVALKIQTSSDRYSGKLTYNLR